jgi:hypothetical protein
VGRKKSCVGKAKKIIASGVVVTGANSRASTNIFEQCISPRVVKVE